MQATKATERLSMKLAVPVAAALIAVLLVLAGCGGSQASSGASGSASSDTGKTVKIAYLPITHALPVFEEVEQLEALAASGEADYSIELVKYGSWPELMDALNSGQVDGASVLVELAMRAAEQGVDLKAAALGHKDGNVIVGSNDVDSVADLKGKTIAIPSRQSSHNILVLSALEEAGISESDVTITELAPTEMPSALASNQIDAYCVAEPFGAKGVEVGAGHVLANSEDLWDKSLCCAFVLNGSFISENPELAGQLTADYKEAGAALEKGDEAKQVAKKYLDQTDDVLDISLQWISYDDLTITEEVYDALVDRVKKYGLSENPPTYDEFVANLG